MKIANCSSCKAEIVWLVTLKGSKMPVDVDSLGLDEEEIRELSSDTIFERAVHVSHFDSCPHANQHRRRK